jgi:hypothetical protein
VARAAGVDAPERPPAARLRGQVPGVIGHERAERHVDDHQRHPGQEQAEGRPGPGGLVGGQRTVPQPWANMMTSDTPTTTVVACMTQWIHRYPKIPITADGMARTTIQAGWTAQRSPRSWPGPG